jgi:hypothetical protein
MPTKKKAVEAPPIAEIVAKDKRRQKLKERAADLSGKVERLAEEIIQGLEAHGVKSVVHQGWAVNVAQAEKVVYDDALIGALTAKERRLACDEIVDLNALDPAVRKRVVEALTPQERKRVTTLRLNVERLSQAVQEGKIDLKLVSRYSSIKKNKPYITPGSGPVKP